jgi:hypothetical protein
VIREAKAKRVASRTALVAVLPGDDLDLIAAGEEAT